MSSKKMYYGLLILLGVSALLYNLKNLQEGATAHSPSSNVSTGSTTVLSKTEKFTADESAEKPSKERRKVFLREFANESRNMAKIDERSKETEDRLIARARDLTPMEIEILKEVSKD